MSGLFFFSVLFRCQRRRFLIRWEKSMGEGESAGEKRLGRRMNEYKYLWEHAAQQALMTTGENEVMSPKPQKVRSLERITDGMAPARFYKWAFVRHTLC